MKITGIRLACFLVILLFASCPEPTGTLKEVHKYDKELWGEWIRMDTGNTWYVASNYINTKDNNDDIKMEKQTKNVIKVTQTKNDTKLIFYLYASRVLNGEFSGSIVGMSDAGPSLNSRAVTGISGIDVILANAKDRANEVQATTDDNGKFTARGIVPGDGYLINGDGFSIPVYPNNSGEDVGTVVVTDGVNLITSIRPQATYGDEYYDMMGLYAGKEYKLKIVFENIGTSDCRAAQYTLTLPEGLELLENVATKGMLATIEPEKTREILIKVKCGNITDEYVYKDIGIKTEDSRGKTWEDSVSLKFNKEAVDFKVYANNKVRGVVIVPNAKAYFFETSSVYSISGVSQSCTVEVPKYLDEGDYLIAFSGATADNEATFSLAVGNKAPISDLGIVDFTYSSCTSEDTAAKIDVDEPIKAYLEKNEIIYFKVSFK
jgi:hypothetical protein